MLLTAPTAATATASHIAVMLRDDRVLVVGHLVVRGGVRHEDLLQLLGGRLALPVGDLETSTTTSVKPHNNTQYHM